MTDFKLSLSYSELVQHVSDLHAAFFLGGGGGGGGGGE